MEGEGLGIIMGVTRLLLLGPFYYIALYWGYRIMNNTVDKTENSKCKHTAAVNAKWGSNSALHRGRYCIRPATIHEARIFKNEFK